jgi:hypothetical protein
MSYKDAQAEAKAALRTYKVRWDQPGVTVNLGIRRYKREHPHLRHAVIDKVKADRWASINRGTKQ